MIDGDSLFVGTLSAMTEQEKTQYVQKVLLDLGADIVSVELTRPHILSNIESSIKEYSSYVNDWVLRNRLGEMLGLPSEVDFTLKYVSNSMYFEQSFTKSIAEQRGLGANGTREYKKDVIYLSANTQDYIIPANREINEVMWYTPSFINLFGLDPLSSSSNLAFTEFGASFAGHTLYHVMPVFDTILTATAAELRNRVRGAEYSYSLHPAANGQKLLRLYPVPRRNGDQAGGGAGLGTSFSTPGSLFYYYYDRYGTYGNPDYSGTSANPLFSGSTGQVGNGLVSSPGDAQLNYIPYNQLNSNAKRWIYKYALALSARTLAWARGKFNSVPIPDAEIQLNADMLMTFYNDQETKLFDKLNKDLEELSYEKIMEKRASVQESIAKAQRSNPMGIWIF